MFTGIIEEVGRIAKIEQRGENRRITIEAPSIAKEVRTGHSVAVSGVSPITCPSTSTCAPLGSDSRTATPTRGAETVLSQ